MHRQAKLLTQSPCGIVRVRHSSCWNVLRSRTSKSARLRIGERNKQSLSVGDLRRPNPERSDVHSLPAQVARLLIRNSPRGSRPDAIARGVTAHIRFMNEAGKVVCEVPKGRWTEAAANRLPDSRIAQSKIDFGIGEPHWLDVAFKYNYAIVAYALNDEAVTTSNWEMHKYILHPGSTFTVLVHLSGEWVDRTFRCELRHVRSHEGDSGRLEFRSLPDDKAVVTQECNEVAAPYQIPGGAAASFPGGVYINLTNQALARQAGVGREDKPQPKLWVTALWIPRRIYPTWEKDEERALVARMAAEFDESVLSWNSQVLIIRIKNVPVGSGGKLPSASGVHAKVTLTDEQRPLPLVLHEGMWISKDEPEPDYMGLPETGPVDIGVGMFREMVIGIQYGEQTSDNTFFAIDKNSLTHRHWQRRELELGGRRIGINIELWSDWGVTLHGFEMAGEPGKRFKIRVTVDPGREVHKCLLSLVPLPLLPVLLFLSHALIYFRLWSQDDTL